MRYRGETVDIALSKGLNDLNVGRDQVEVTVISQGKKGFWGIGKKDAEVEINVLEKNDQNIDDYPKKIEKEVIKYIKTEEQRLTPKQTSDEKQIQIEDAVQEVGNYLIEITGQLGIESDIDITIDHKNIYYDFETEQSGLLIGKHGKTINALQILAQAYLDKNIKYHYRIILDVDNYREKRKVELKRIAKNLAQRAVVERRTFKLGPMPAMERKIVHKVLADNRHVRAKSHGKDPYRYIIIAPKIY